MTAFAKLVGQSFEVQSIIALVNTVLTTLGLVALKLPGYGFLSLVVLITSFIPVFGVFLSTFPMALVALSEFGVRKMLDVILMVIGIHVVEVGRSGRWVGGVLWMVGWALSGTQSVTQSVPAGGGRLHGSSTDHSARALVCLTNTNQG